MAEAPKRIHIGTSGWHYQHWSGPFYPKNLRKQDFLKHYACHFHTVEINNSFYQLPTEKTLAAWRDTVLPGFIFTVKASRYITHMKKLKDSEKTLKPLLKRVETLGDKLGPILFQLPPKWRFNPDRLNDFLESLPAGYRYALEFRDPSWEDSRAYDAMQLTGAAFCIYELDGYLSPKEITADFVYVRLHGPNGPYKGQYSTQTLAGWAGAFSAWENQGLEIFCYFDNDEAGYAAQDARRLQDMIYGKG
jgi:uncharacterized protein YecE (DUF72 family)